MYRIIVTCIVYNFYEGLDGFHCVSIHQGYGYMIQNMIVKLPSLESRAIWKRKRWAARNRTTWIITGVWWGTVNGRCGLFSVFFFFWVSCVFLFCVWEQFSFNLMYCIKLIHYLYMLFVALRTSPLLTVVHTTACGCRTPPISQLTVRVLPLITNSAFADGVTIYWPNRPAISVND